MPNGNSIELRATEKARKKEGNSVTNQRAPLKNERHIGSLEELRRIRINSIVGGK